MSIIYKTTNTITGKIYIGQHWNDVEDNYLGSGTLILLSIKKHGSSNFVREVLEYCDESTVESLERYWIKCFNSTDRNIGYNLSSGGKCLSGKDNPNYGNTWSDKQKNHLSQVKKSNGDWCGDKNPKHGAGHMMSGADNSFYGKSHTPDARQKMSDYASSISHNDEYKRNMRNTTQKFKYFKYDVDNDNYVLISDLYEYCVNHKYNYRSLKEAVRCGILYKKIKFIRERV